MDAMREVPVMTAEVEEEAVQPAAVPEVDPVIAALDRRIRELEAAMGDLRTGAASGARQMAAGLKTHVPEAGHGAHADDGQGSAAAAKQTVAFGRKTLGALLPGLALREGVVQAGSLEDAMQGMSIEQRIALKGEMMRKGLL